MNRIASRLRTVNLLAALVLLAACSGTMDGEVKAPESLKGTAKAGETAVAARGCGGCHSSSAGKFAGSPAGKGSAANLTPDKATGLGGWSDEDIVGAIRDGIDHEQNTLCSGMPRAHDMSDEEAANIVAFLKTLTPVSNQVTEAKCTPSPADSAHHGKLVVEAQHCSACHGDDLAGSEGLGGGTVFASNLTPDKETGLGLWSKSQVALAVRTGTDDEGGSLCSQMPRFENLTDDEVNGVAEFLATLEPVNHKVPESTCGTDVPDPLEDGKTYVTNRKCNACHSANLGGKASCKPGDASNLTGTNLGTWSNDQIIAAMRSGVDEEGKMLSNKMPRFDGRRRGQSHRDLLAQRAQRGARWLRPRRR